MPRIRSLLMVTVVGLAVAGAYAIESAAAQPEYGYDDSRPSRVRPPERVESLDETLGMAVGAGVAVVVLALSWVLMLMSVVGYVLARWRAGREGTAPDPHLGLKTALWFFRVLACHVLLVGGLVFLYALMTKMGEPTKKDLYRLAGGLLVPGILVYLAHFALTFATNARQLPIVTRLFAGANALFVGLLAFTALVAAFVLAFQREPSTEAHRFAWSAVLVYLPTWAVQSWMLFRRGGIGLRPLPGMPNAPAPGSPPAPVPPAPAA